MEVNAQASAKNSRKTLLWGNIKLKVAGAPPYYGFGGVLCLYLLLFGLMAAISQIHRSLWPASFYKYWYYDPPLAVFLVVSTVFYRNPKLLAFSTWKFRAAGISVGILAGMLGPFLLWWLTHLGVRAATVSLQSSAFVPIVCLSPVLEELLFRATFLKSMKTLMPSVLAVALAGALAALGHHSFWIALPTQVIFSALYLAFGDSVSVSIAAHIANNGLAFWLARQVH
jgi:membrane protease YdiL (CAAX protease family)